ncbi:uncharacterized protein A4U43_UnF2450 [Asparagus officinalis]|uniref:PDZ domain-containing protein n=1 Tax=Asparagus officinalis TaxID=4686 RepID=A0A1R3L789_ASPOF|nr:uncharacterized protein A4U43_UnF2450 [Asparagus officinalis]
MFRFLSSNPQFRNPNRTLAGIAAPPAASASFSSSSGDLSLTVRFQIPTISLSAPLPQFLSHHRNPADIGLSPINFSSEPFKKEAFREKGDDSACGCGCLSRNAIGAKGRPAACGPRAVVNISVTRGARTVSKGKVDVTLQDGREYIGTVVNADLRSDIAIVKIEAKTPLPAVKLGSSSKLRPGDWVVAVGCPLTLQNTVTAGIVSCVDRKSSDLGLGGMRREYLQTDCAINEGNSGGPLINLDGEVVGINIMKLLNADGLSFAVPIDSAVKIIEHFKKNGRVVRPWLGLKMLDLNDMIIAQLKERDASFPDVSKGVLVPMVTPGSPADRAGFRPGDVVIEFDGKPVGSVKEIINIMGDKIGVPLKVLVKRANNKFVTLTVVPEEANPAH